MEGWKVNNNCGPCRGYIHGGNCEGEIDNNDPRLTPTQLCVLALVNKLERNREENYTGTMTHAWACIETSLASCASYPQFAYQQMQEAFRTIDEIILDRSKNIVETCEAVSLKNYEPLFIARTTLAPITAELASRVRQDIGALICAIDTAEDVPPQYDGYMSGFVAEEIVSWLALYSDDPRNIIFPTSHREGRSDMRRYNHDRYQLRHETKVPVEIKRRHRHRKPSRRRSYEKPIIKIVLQDILDQTRGKHGSLRSRRDNFLIDLIQHDLSGRASAPKEKVLRTASNIVIKMIDDNFVNNM